MSYALTIGVLEDDIISSVEQSDLWLDFTDPDNVTFESGTDELSSITEKQTGQLFLRSSDVSYDSAIHGRIRDSGGTLQAPEKQVVDGITHVNDTIEAQREARNVITRSVLVLDAVARAFEIKKVATKKGREWHFGENHKKVATVNDKKALKELNDEKPRRKRPKKKIDGTSNRFKNLEIE